MINASTDFIQAIQDGRTDYLMQISVTLKSGTTILLDEEKIWGDSVKLEDATAQGDDFAVGAFVSTKLSFSINNMSGAYSDDILYNFADAEMSVELGLDIDGTVEYITLGTFWVDDVDYDGSLISFVCTDRARFFNKPYTSAYNSGTATIRQLLTEAVVTCLGSSSYLMSETFPNEDYTVKLPFSHDSITFADVVAMVAQLGGCFAKIGADGKLYIKTYPTISEYIHPDNRYDPVYAEGHGYHVIRSLKSAKIQKHDCQVTKISVIEETGDSDPGTASYPTGGADDYVIEVSGNRLISAGQSYSAALGIWSVVGGRRFRPLSISTLTNPLIEAGDVMYVVTGKDYEYSELKTRGNDYINTADDKRINAGKLSDGIYFSFITSRSMTLGSGVTIECAGAPVVADGQAQTSYTELSKAIAKERQIADINEQRAAAARAQLEESIYNSLGLYQTEETQPGGGVIKYYHDKPELSNSQYIWKFDADSITVSADGGVHWSAAFDARGNALLKYLAVDQISATWIKTGILDADLLTTGTIQSPNNPDNYWNLATGELHLGGSDIVTVSNVIYEYATGSDPVNAPETGWSTSSPEWSSTEYIWARSVTIYTDGDSVTGTPVCIQGPAGSTGPRGVSIVAATPEYAMNTSMEVAPPSSSFTPDIPELPAPEVGQPNYCIWTRFKVEYSEGSPTYSTPKVDTALNAYYSGYHTFINDTDHLKSEYEKLERYVGYSTIITHNDGQHILIEDGTSEGKQIAVMQSDLMEMLSETTRQLNTKIEQTEAEIRAEASEIYETKTAAQTTYGELQAGITINAGEIDSVAERTEKQYNSLSEFAGISGILTKSNEYIVTKDSPEGDNRKPIVSVSGILYDTMREIQTFARTEIQQTADNITQTVEATYATKGEVGEYRREADSKIDQRADSVLIQVNERITDEINDVTTAYTSAIATTAEGITAAAVLKDELDGDQFEIAATQGGGSVVKITREAVTFAVFDPQGEYTTGSVGSYIKQAANDITNIVAKTDDLESLAGFYGIATRASTSQEPQRIILNDDGDLLIATAGDIFNRLHIMQADTATAIQQTEDRIALVATNASNDIASIRIYADRINSTVTDAYNNASHAEQTATGISFALNNSQHFSFNTTSGLTLNLGSNSGLQWDTNGNLKVKVSSLNLTFGDITDGATTNPKTLLNALADKLNLKDIDTGENGQFYFDDVTNKLKIDKDGLDLSVSDVSDAVGTEDFDTGNNKTLKWESGKLKVNSQQVLLGVESLVNDSTGLLSWSSNKLTIDQSKIQLSAATKYIDPNTGTAVDLSTLLVVTPENVQMKWNQVSDYIQFDGSAGSASIKFLYSNGYLLARLNKNGTFYYDGSAVPNLLAKITPFGTTYYDGSGYELTKITANGTTYYGGIDGTTDEPVVLSEITRNGIVYYQSANLKSYEITPTMNKWYGLPKQTTQGYVDRVKAKMGFGGLTINDDNERPLLTLGTDESSNEQGIFWYQYPSSSSTSSNRKLRAKISETSIAFYTLYNNNAARLFELSNSGLKLWTPEWANTDYPEETKALYLHCSSYGYSQQSYVAFASLETWGSLEITNGTATHSNAKLIYNSYALGSSSLTGTDDWRSQGFVFNDYVIIRSWNSFNCYSAANFRAGIDVTNGATISSGLTVSSGGLTVTGSSTLNNGLTVSSGGLTVTGNSTLYNDLTVNGSLSAGSLSVSGSMSYSSLSLSDSLSVGTSVYFGNSTNSLYIGLKSGDSNTIAIGAPSSTSGTTYFIEFHKNVDSGNYIHIAPTTIFYEDITLRKRLWVVGTSQFDGLVTFNNGTNPPISGSDARLKKNISPSTVKALEAVTGIDVKSFDWIRDGGHTSVGIIAQQLQQVAPELVIEHGEEKEQGVNFIGLLNYCVKAIQELADMVGYKPKKHAEWVDPYTLEEKLKYNELHSHT